MAVDEIRATFPQATVLVGRLGGPTFDFLTPNPPDGQVAGSGFFMVTVGESGDQFSTSSVRFFGGTPQEAVGTKDHAGAGARFENGIFTAVFEGTMTIEGKVLTSPSNAPAIAVAIFNYTNGAFALSSAFAFPKGAGSKGKLSRPRVVRVADKYVLADTVWDSIDVGGTIVQAKQGADVALVGFDGTGKGLWSRVYGGAGDDESYELTNDQVFLYWTGHSASSIDFGNGALKTSAVDGEAWATEIHL
ncbi:hypothetical protein BH09MYX1_BH09MYX1_43570 [soil metagenome]